MTKNIWTKLSDHRIQYLEKTAPKRIRKKYKNKIIISNTNTVWFNGNKIG